MESMLTALKETFDAELEGIEAVYGQDSPIAEACEFTQKPKHVLSKEPPPKPKLTEIVQKATKKGEKDKVRKVWVTPKVELDKTPVEVLQFAFSLKPQVGSETQKIGLACTLRLIYQSNVSLLAQTPLELLTSANR